MKQIDKRNTHKPIIYSKLELHQHSYAALTTTHHFTLLPSPSLNHSIHFTLLFIKEDSLRLRPPLSRFILLTSDHGSDFHEVDDPHFDQIAL